jgi:pimeloyl-ACP methyl ester carboxylesterase
MTGRRVSRAVPDAVESPSGALRIVFERWGALGQEHGTVVLLPGGGQTRHSWDRSAAALQADGWTAVTVDLRGHGDSDWDPTGDYSVGALADDLTAVLAKTSTGRRPPVLIGASLGGLAALVACGRKPDCCSGLVLVDIALRVEPEGRDRIRAFMTAKPDGFGSLDEAAAAVASYRIDRPRTANLDGLARNLRRGRDGRLHWHWDPQILHQEHDTEDPSHPARVQLRDAAAAVRVPTLLVRGLLSDVVSDAGLQEAMTLLPDASVVEISDADHMVVGDDNISFLAVVRNFLRSVQES